MAQQPPRIISGGGTFDLGIYYFFMLQSKSVFCLKLPSALRGLSHRRGHVLMSFVILPQPGITCRYLQQECGAAASVRACIPHPFKCAAAAVQLLSHPILSHPQTHPVGVRTCYHTPFFSPPLIYHTPKHTLWVFGRPVTPPGLSHPPCAPCELHFITRGTQDITHPTGYRTR